MRWRTRWSAGPVNGAWDLGKDETSHLPEARGEVTIRVERGLALVTREGDLQDHVLRAGDSLVLPPRGKVVAWALEPTRATVREARAGASRQGRHQPLPVRARWRWTRP